MQNENLGAAERIVESLIGFKDHMVHNRPGIVTPDGRARGGVRWEAVTHKLENGEKVVYRLVQNGKKETKVRAGVMRDPAAPDALPPIVENGRQVGLYKEPGIFPEMAVWLYRQVAEVWKLDNEFAARWASYAFGEDNKDLKVVLAAFMLVQARKGDPIMDEGKVAFYDDDFRDVGEAMALTYRKGVKTDFDAKLIRRVRSVLTLPEIAKINRELGFAQSATKPTLGRWPAMVEKWLRHREENPKLLEGLVKAGFRRTVIELAKHVGYKPSTPWFFQVLRWKQAQASDGRRTLAIGEAVKAAETWEGLTEEAICEKIVKERPSYKRITGLLPAKIGLTRAIMAAAIEAQSVSTKDLIILTPTLEELGLLQVPVVRKRWEDAVKAAEDTRAANIARRVKSKETQDALQDGADAALKKAVEEVIRGIVLYVLIDISGSMTQSVPKAKEIVAKFLQAFPSEKLHVAVFNTTGRRVAIKHASKAGIDNAFKGIQPGGGTDHAAGIRVLQDTKPGAGEDAIIFVIGDEGQHGDFAPAVRGSGINPVAFGLLKLPGDNHNAVTNTARALGVPCFNVDERTFNDPYAIPATIRALIAAAPVGAHHVNVPKRESLAEKILKTELLQKPAWAA